MMIFGQEFLVVGLCSYDHPMGSVEVTNPELLGGRWGWLTNKTVHMKSVQDGLVETGGLFM